MINVGDIVIVVIDYASECESMIGEIGCVREVQDNGYLVGVIDFGNKLGNTITVEFKSDLKIKYKECQLRKIEKKYDVFDKIKVISPYSKFYGLSGVVVGVEDEDCKYRPICVAFRNEHVHDWFDYGELELIKKYEED